MKHSTKISTLATLLIGLAGCASTADRAEPPISAVSPGVAQIAQEEGGIKKDDERVHCEYIRPTGSNRPRKVCWTREERREARERSVELLNRVQNASEPIPEASGGN